MKSIVFRIFAPYHSPGKLFPFFGVILVLSLGVGIFLSIQILLSNYSRSFALKVIESKEEILIVGNRPGKTLRERMKIQEGEERELCRKIHDGWVGVVASPFLKRTQFELSFRDGDYSFPLRPDLLIGIDYDGSKALLPVLDQVNDVAREMFSNGKSEKIPMLVSEKLLSEAALNCGAFEISANGQKVSAEIIGTLRQNDLFPVQIIVIPLRCAKDLFGVSFSDGIGVRTFDERNSLDISAQIADELGDDFLVQHWSESLKELDGIFKAINVIISLVVSSLFVLAFLFSVATFDILMKRKKMQLSLLLALGMPPAVIRSGLLSLGGLVGVVCCALGFGVAYLFLTIAPRSPLAPVFEQMMVDDFAFRCEWTTIALVFVVALLVPLSSAWVAAGRAFKIDPVEDLRK